MVEASYTVEITAGRYSASDRANALDSQSFAYKLDARAWAEGQQAAYSNRPGTYATLLTPTPGDDPADETELWHTD